MGHLLVAVDQREDRAGHERAEDHLEPQVLGERGERDHQHERAADADLRGRVLEAQRRCRGCAHRVLGAVTARPTTHREQHEAAEQQQLSSRCSRPRGRRRCESRITAPKSAIEPAAMTSWPNCEPISPASLSTGIDDAERRRRQDDRDQQRRVDRARRPSARGRRRARARRRRAKPTREPQHAPAQRVELDLEPGEEEQEGEADQRETSIGSSISTQPSTAGPITIPATISSTTEGSAERGARPSSSGAAKADRDDHHEPREVELAHACPLRPGRVRAGAGASRTGSRPMRGKPPAPARHGATVGGAALPLHGVSIVGAE